MSSRIALALILLFLTSCHSHLTAMQGLDLLVTAAAQLCPKGTLEKPTQTKLLNCRRADTCLRPVAAAQHAHQDALLAMSRLEDSAGLRLAAEAATAGAIASCRVVGIVVAGAVPAVPAAPTVPTVPVVPVVPVAPVAPAAPANPMPTATPTPAPVAPTVAPVVPVPAPTAPAPAPVPQPAQPTFTIPTAPTPAP